MAIAFVQYDDFYEAAGDTTIANDTALNTTTGNFLVVSVSGYAGDDSGIADSIADTAGNTYVKAVQEEVGVSAEEATSIWYAENITGNANNVTTVTYKGTAGDRYISVAEYSGIAASSSLDDTASNVESATTSHSSGNATASIADALVFGGMNMVNRPNITVGAGFTTLSSDLTSIYSVAEYKIVASTGAYAATFTSSINTNSAICVAIFKGVTVAGAAGIMTTNAGYWGPTF